MEDNEYSNFPTHPSRIGSAPKYPAIYSKKEVQLLTDPTKLFGVCPGRKIKKLVNGLLPLPDKDKFYNVISASISRQDKSKPPACILCLNLFVDDPDISQRIGSLFWFPRLPDFFAVHEGCMRMCPLAVSTADADEKFTVTRSLCSITFDSLANEIKRIFIVKCSFCNNRNAIIGCFNSRCKKTFHLPCAIKQKFIVDFETVRVFCTPHLSVPYETYVKKAIDDLIIKFKKVEGEKKRRQLEESKKKENEKSIMQQNRIARNGSQICITCQCELTKEEMKPDYEKIIFTKCCGDLYHHFECMLGFVSTRGLLTKCPHCNSEHLFQVMIDAQGLAVYNVDPNDEGPSSEENIPCFAGDECLCIEGPTHYVEDLPEEQFEPFCSLNKCPGCARMIHRGCAGPPWNDEEDFKKDEIEEPLWICADCRKNGLTQREAQFYELAEKVPADEWKKIVEYEKRLADSMNQFGVVEIEKWSSSKDEVDDAISTRVWQPSVSNDATRYISEVSKIRKMQKKKHKKYTTKRNERISKFNQVPTTGSVAVIENSKDTYEGFMERNYKMSRRNDLFVFNNINRNTAVQDDDVDEDSDVRIEFLQLNVGSSTPFRTDAMSETVDLDDDSVVFFSSYHTNEMSRTLGKDDKNEENMNNLSRESDIPLDPTPTIASRETVELHLRMTKEEDVCGRSKRKTPLKRSSKLIAENCSTYDVKKHKIDIFKKKFSCSTEKENNGGTQLLKISPATHSFENSWALTDSVDSHSAEPIVITID